MPRLKHPKGVRYVVGFSQRGSCVYGKDVNGRADWADPMNKREAERYLKTQLWGGTKATMFKLVPVLTIKTKRNA